MADPSPAPSLCAACGGRLTLFIRLKRSEARTPLAYFKCERCAHVLITEE